MKKLVASLAGGPAPDTADTPPPKRIAPLR